MTTPRFGVSTHLYHHQRLSRDHLVEIAAHGFEAVELFAMPTHFDYRNPAAIADLQEWLADTRLDLHAIHAPIVESLSGTRWGPSYSNASADEAVRRAAVQEADAALNVARRIPADYLVVHLGRPYREAAPAGDNSRAAAARSLEELQALVRPIGIRLALEIIPNDLSRPEALVHLLEEEVDLPDAGLCFDFGHAHLFGDVLDAVETASGHLVTTHVHDNGGRSDDHLVPFEGTIDWHAALTAVQKVGYEGTFMLELAARGTPRQTLERAQTARDRFEKILGG
ncbi:MAG: sugar phosphate isomerase/epimerase [Acidobacteriota bacterium]|nr:sugar phosphate isomerase/epimerase [Acidobacteriota bacterium]